MAANDVGFFLGEAGDSITYTPAAGGGGRGISAILLDVKPVIMTEPSADLEFQQLRIQVSARNDTEGVTKPQVGGFLGQAADRVTNLLTAYAATWYVIDVIADNDAGLHTLVLRDKQFPKGAM